MFPGPAARRSNMEFGSWQQDPQLTREGLLDIVIMDGLVEAFIICCFVEMEWSSFMSSHMSLTIFGYVGARFEKFPECNWV